MSKSSGKIEFKPNREGIKKLMESEEVENVLREQVDRLAERASASACPTIECEPEVAEMLLGSEMFDKVTGKIKQPGTNEKADMYRELQLEYSESFKDESKSMKLDTYLTCEEIFRLIRALF